MPLAYLLQHLEHGDFLLFLRPFKELALEVDIGLLQFIDVNMYLDDAIDDDVLGEVETLIKIDGTHEGFEGIATHRTGIVTHIGGMADIGTKAQFFRQFVEGNTTHNAGTHLGEEAFGLGGISVEEIIGHDSA